MGERDELLERAASIIGARDDGKRCKGYACPSCRWIADYEAHKAAETTERERKREGCK